MFSIRKYEFGKQIRKKKESILFDRKGRAYYLIKQRDGEDKNTNIRWRKKFGEKEGGGKRKLG